jgi:hypothetical protein
MFDIDRQNVLVSLYQLGIAYVLALPVARDREREAISAGP